MYGAPDAGIRTPVLFISSAEQPGADTFIHTLIMRSLDRARFDVHVACSAGTHRAGTPAFDLLATIPDLHLRPANFGPSLSARSTADKVVHLFGLVPALAGLAGLSQYVRRRGIAVLHATDRPRDAVACAVLGKLTGAKSIIHVHLKCADWMSRPVRWAMREVDALMGVSQFVTQSLVDNGYPAAKTYTVLNAIDLSAWDYRQPGGPVRAELGIAAGAPVITCAARLFRGKGQDDVIRALPALRQEFPDVRLLIVGRDDRQAMRTSFTEELKTLARDLGVSDHVIFTGQRPDMAALMAASDVFALPSWEEPFGLVFAEAMAMKRPVVALDSGGASEIVEHGKSGFLCVPADHESLVTNLRTLLHDPALRARMGEYGRRQVETRFTARRMADDVGAVYMSLLSPQDRDRVALESHVSTV
jgi:glycosyltransferase involved in cell wall biosynthesis